MVEYYKREHRDVVEIDIKDVVCWSLCNTPHPDDGMLARYINHATLEVIFDDGDYCMYLWKDGCSGIYIKYRQWDLYWKVKKAIMKNEYIVISEG